MALTPKARIKINLVGFFVLSLALIYGMATQVLSVLQDRYSVYALFPDAGGVFTNQEVTYRGVTVGHVGSMEVVEDGVKIELSIDEGVKIPADGVEARVMFKSAVGEQFVDLLPTSDGAPFLANEDVITMDRTSIPVSTQELLSTVEAVLRGVPPRALKGTIDALGGGLANRGRDIGILLESTADLAELFAQRAPEVESILDSGTRVGAAFLESRQEFAIALQELVSVSEALAASTPDLERLLRGTNETSDELVALLRQERPEVNEVIVNLAKINALQAAHGDDLERLFAQLPPALARVARTFEPDTGMIRFGLVQDQDIHGCSYGTDRRRPEERGNRPIPKRASCGEPAEDPGPLLPALTGDAPAGERANSAATEAPMLLPGVEPLEVGPSPTGIGGGIPLLPHRMADRSWTLFYLNVM